MRRKIAVLLCVAMTFLSAGCQTTNKTKDYTPVSGLDTDQKVVLTIAIPYETNKALNTVANSFMEMYPNVNVNLQYVEDYDQNAVTLFKNDSLDMILQKDVAYTEYTVTDAETEEKTPDGTTTEDFFYNFADDKEIDFSNTAAEISDNYRHTRTDADGNSITYQYSYPLGGETRGVFVNKTLLDQYGLEVPSNYTELLNCCEVLKENGLIPIQGGGDTAAYGLGLAPAANPVVHDEAALEKMSKAEAGISKEFEDTLYKMYTLATKRYFDYKAVEETGYYVTTNELGQAESFLGLYTNPDTLEIEKPDNNYGMVAFMPYISSTETVIQSLIDEYELDTEVQFICSPLNDEGSKSPLYVTPYYGICLNKNSENLIWSREFVNFLFQQENNRTYSEEAAIIPNTKDAIDYAAEKYDVDVDKDVTMCGQIRFSDDYNGFNPLSTALKDTLKCSAQKYMVDLNRDEDGNSQYQKDDEGKNFLYKGDGESIVYEEYVGEEDPTKPGYAFCTFDYFMNEMEEQFGEYRAEADAQ